MLLAISTSSACSSPCRSCSGLYRRAVEDYTPAEQEMMFAGTAERVYRI